MKKQKLDKSNCIKERKNYTKIQGAYPKKYKCLLPGSNQPKTIEKRKQKLRENQKQK
jgi:hypothetical protein